MPSSDTSYDRIGISDELKMWLKQNLFPEKKGSSLSELQELKWRKINTLVYTGKLVQLLFMVKGLFHASLCKHTKYLNVQQYACICKCFMHLYALWQCIKRVIPRV